MNMMHSPWLTGRLWSRSLLVAALLLPAAAYGQLPLTQVRTLFPPGGQAGTDVVVEVVEGDDLDELSRLVFSHPGIQVMDPPDPLSNPRKFTVRIAQEVTPGYYSVRAVGRFGLSNPRMFRVEQHPTTAVAEAELQKQIPFPLPLASPLYSRIDAAGDKDEFVSELREGVAYSLTVDALAIDSKLAAMVEVFAPSGKRIQFSRQTALLDPKIVFVAPQTGAYRIVINDFLFRGAINFAYRLQIQEGALPSALESPVLPSVERAEVVALVPKATAETGAAAWERLPLPAEPIDSSAGRVLPGFLSPRRSFEPLRTVRLALSDTVSDLVSLPPALAGPVAEQEPNDEPENAQQLQWPVEVHGRFQRKDDVDVYEFAGTKGQQLWIQILSERDGQGLDPFLMLEQITQNAAGQVTTKPIAIPDDLTTNLLPAVFDTLTDDVDFLLTVAEDATFRLKVRNRYYVADELSAHHYRLVITPPQPRFTAVALNAPAVVGTITADTPAGCVLRRGGTATYTVLLHRMHGHNEPVLIEAAQVPPGLAIAPVIIPPGATQGTLIIDARSDAPAGIAELKLQAREWREPGAAEAASAETASSDTAQDVIPAAVIWKGDATYPAVSRLGHSLQVSILEEQAPTEIQVAAQPAVWHVSQGQTIWHPLEVRRHAGFADKVDFTATGIDAKTKITVAVPGVAKEQSTTAVKFTFPADCAEGWQSSQLKLSAQFDYVRNPELLARTEAKHQELETQLAGHQQAVKTHNEMIAATGKALEELQKQLAQTGQQVTAAEAQLTTLKTQLEQLAAADVSGLNETELAAAAEKQKTVEAEQAKLAAEQAERKQTLAKLQQEEPGVTAALASHKAELVKATASVTASEKQLADHKKVLDKMRTDQKAKPVKYETVVENFVFQVHKAPIKLTLKTPAEMTIKKGETGAATVELTRSEGVSGPVQFTLNVAPGVTGITLEPATLAADQNSVALQLAVAADANPGKIESCTIRGTTQHQGHALSVDVPVSITVP